MGCGTKTIKILAISFNILIAIIGILIIIGAAHESSEGDIDKSTAVSTYIIGVAAIILAIIGCLAALRESVNLAIFCTLFFFGLAITHIVLTCIKHNAHDPNEAVKLLDEAWNNSPKMDEIQMKYECCGKGSGQDYIIENRVVPSSCYAGKDNSKADKLFFDGCVAKVQKYYEVNARNVIIASCVLIAFELIGFFLHLYLFINFRNKQRRLQF